MLLEQVVVDASVAAAWVLPEARTDAAMEHAQRWLQRGVRLLAPGLFAAELTNAFHKRVRREEMALETAREALRTLALFDIELREEPGVPDRALVLAASNRLPSAYDCYYLALAEASRCDYWTADERFFNVVSDREPRVRWIGAGD